MYGMARFERRKTWHVSFKGEALCGAEGLNPHTPKPRDRACSECAQRLYTQHMRAVSQLNAMWNSVEKMETRIATMRLLLETGAERMEHP